ncbi:hypothetical protein K491DRAFT_673941 [Lophiostoma macrostomum CBS 122681]|uniref:Condensation domain-containing protein n=1 Tax=Lophiostoma macrostomum CBS 122681 TaxID=1314788 RepID=A0A6A6TQ07_9PLEO|nr:hypothetical protein K491DRAFT_673941 [Lophiostoma macrostomum CBS 122681]
MKFPWKETAPGTVVCQLDNSERFLRAVAIPFRSLGRENWALNIILKIDFENSKQYDIAEALRETWLKIRYHHPLIAAHLHIDENRFEYATPDEQALQAWLSDSFFVHDKETVDEFLLQAGWSDLSSLHFFPNSSEIIMRTHHWLVDGVGAFHLAHRFCELFAKGGPAPQFGDEAQFLPPCLLDAAGLPGGGDEAAQHKAQARFMDFAANLPSIGLPTEHSPTGPGGSKRQHISFPREKLDALLKACRAKDTTIAAAVHAAVAVATQEKAYNSDVAKNFTSVAFFDYRKYLPAPYCDSRQYPMGVWILGLPFSLPSTDFATHVETCRKVYKQPVARDVFPLFDAYEVFCGMMADAFGAPPSPGIPLPSQPQLSSIGLIDGKDGKIQRSYSSERSATILRVEPVLDSMVTTPVLFQWTFDNVFYINACYNEKWNTDDFIADFLQIVGRVLMESMGVA